MDISVVSIDASDYAEPGGDLWHHSESGGASIEYVAPADGGSQIRVGVGAGVSITRKEV